MRNATLRHWLFAATALAAAAAPASLWADSFEASTEDSPTWFRLYTPNRNNLMMSSQGIATKMKGLTGQTAPYASNMLWRFEATSTGASTYYIVSMDGHYIDPATFAPVGNAAADNAFCPVTSKPSQGWTFTATGSNYIIASGTVQLHQGEAGTYYQVINYGGGSNTTDAGCVFTLEKVTVDDTYKAQATAKGLYNLTTEGTDPGQYSAEARTALLSAATGTDASTIQTAIDTYKEAMVKVQAGKTYFIKSSASKSYCEGMYIYSTGSGSQPQWGEKLVAGDYAWTFEDAGDSKFYIKNFSTGEYLVPGSDKNTSTSADSKTAYTVSSLGQGTFNLTPDGKNPLHAQQDGSVLVTWQGGLGTASSWALEEIDESDLNTPASITSVSVGNGSQTYAPGNTDQVLLTTTVNVGGFSGNVSVSAFQLDLSGCDAAATDFENLKVYTTTSANFVGDVNKSNATLLGTLASVEGTTATVTLASPYQMRGNTTFWLTADIADDATVGNAADTELLSITYNDGENFTVENGNPEGTPYIYRVSYPVFAANDLNSHYWRIPGMIVLRNQQGENESKNGRVVTLADMRFTHNGDLPNHIDVYERHSDDNGKTWSTAQLVAGTTADENLAQYGNKGFGDAALVETASGKIIAIMAGGNGYFQSTKQQPIGTFIITSTDGGETWTAPKSLFETVYNHSYSEGQVLGTFAGSGRGILLKNQANPSRNGRIMFAMSHRFSNTGIQEYIIYSDDEGETWNFSQESAYSGGDESKLVELADGTIMISVRQSGNRGFNTSTDGGITWGTQTLNADISGNACNADILAYSDGILIHTYINNSSRKNLTICTSTDNGKTWTNKRVLCAPSSCYSTIDKMPNGDIAVFFEDNSTGDAFNLNFITLPLNFLLPENYEKEELTALAEKAREMCEAGGYTEAADATAGQYSQEALDELEKAIPTEAEIENMTDYAAATAALNEAIDKARASVCTIDGYENNTLFAIRSYENIALASGSTPMYFNSTATATADADEAQQWLILPAQTEGYVYIKQKESEQYLIRSNNTTAVSATAGEWSAEKGEGEYWHFKDNQGRGTYIVINTTSGAYNFWSTTAGNETWSTKFVLEPKGTTVGLQSVTTENESNGPTRIFTLSGVQVRTNEKLPAGVYIKQTGKRSEKIIVR